MHPKCNPTITRDTVYAIGGSLSGNGMPRQCQFPFNVNRVTYLGCTDDPLTGRGTGQQGKLWCATKQIGDLTIEWGYCLVDNGSN